MQFLLKEASKLFTSKGLSQLADGDMSLIKKISTELLGGDVCSSLYDTYNKIYCIIDKKYKTEYFFKNAIVNRHLLGKHSLNTATMLSEFRVGSSKADCVIINGSSVCYEIKTEYDSLYRLDEQLKDYCAFFDEVYVVCAPLNFKSVYEATPDSVGIMVLTADNYLSVKKLAKKRTEPLCPVTVIKSLRKDEYILLAELISGEKITCSNSDVFSVCLDKFYQAEPDALAEQLRMILKLSRKNNKEFICSLPYSLKNAAISYSFNKKQIDSLIIRFNS
ncbi:MAG: sce7726 family protein [Aeromonas veronii]|nr:sce7726 family protein [Aeromonas hydrophila]